MEKENNVKLPKESEKDIVWTEHPKNIQWLKKGKGGRKPKQTSQE